LGGREEGREGRREGGRGVLVLGFRHRYRLLERQEEKEDEGGREEEEEQQQQEEDIRWPCSLKG